MVYQVLKALQVLKVYRENKGRKEKRGRKVVLLKVQEILKKKILKILN
jgi:hypothetical protein